MACSGPHDSINVQTNQLWVCSVPSHPCAPADGSEDFVVVGTNTRALWPALADALLMFPYTRDARLALLNLLCSQQVNTTSVICMQHHTYDALSDACLLQPAEAQLATVLFCCSIIPEASINEVKCVLLHLLICTCIACCCIIAFLSQFDMRLL